MSVSDPHNMAERLQRLENSVERLRVLIIDRHGGERSLLHITLSTLGITSIHNARSSAEVLRQVKAHEFDVIFADYFLDDGRDGQQLLEELRQSQLIRRSTVYMLVTAERGYRNVVSVAELTPDDYLIKPFTAELLEERLIRALYKKRFFEEVFRHLDNGELVAAFAVCKTLLGRDVQFQPDVLRHMGAILNTLGRHDDALSIYQRVLGLTSAPWARMGLATAHRGLDDLAEAEQITTALIEEFPDYLAAYDFLAGICEEQGKLARAQELLQQAASRSPNNSGRQRMIGEIAVRNDDLDTAERAYGKVLERRRGSSLHDVDDYTNLTRVMLDRGHTEGARRLTQELRRHWRGDSRGELAALVMDSLCASREGEPAKAKQALESAISLHEVMQGDADSAALPGKIAVDLAHACLAVGDEAHASGLLGRVAAENHEDRGMIGRIQAVFAKTGKEEAGRELLAQVGREIVELNNRGVLAQRSGNPQASTQALIEAAERVPSLQFLTDAARAIFSQLDRSGWNEDLAQRAVRYLQLAQTKDPHSPKVALTRELYLQVARKYGIEAAPGALRGGAVS